MVCQPNRRAGREEGEASVPCNVLQFAVDENEDPADLNLSVTSTEGMN